MYKHIVFDVDGTLIDTEYAILQSLQKTIKITTGNIVELNDLKFALGITGKDALGRLNISDTCIPLTLDLWRENMGNFCDTINVFSGITELLDALKLSGYELGIVTSKTKDEIEYDFIRFGIGNYFRTIICADDTLEHKPNPAPLIKYMEAANISNQDVLYIGDSEYDMKCAQGANIDFALACWGSNSRDMKAKYYLEKPSDVLKVK